MDGALKRKLNILINLAKIDGQFHVSEKAMLLDLMKELRLNPKEFTMLEDNPEKMEPYKIKDRVEMMYLAFQLMNADEHLDEMEMNFCMDLAYQLGIKPRFVDEFAEKDLSRTEFDKEINNWWI